GVACRERLEPQHRRGSRIRIERSSSQLRALYQLPLEATPDAAAVVAASGRRRGQLGGHPLGGPFGTPGAPRLRAAHARGAARRAGSTAESVLVEERQRLV